MGLLTESGTTGNPYVFLARAGRAIMDKEAVAAHGPETLRLRLC